MTPLELVDLSGSWSFRLDPDDAGMHEMWFGDELPDIVELPGSLDENGVGEPNCDLADLSGLARKVRYTGAAWYSRSVELPALWRGERLSLCLERVHWFSDLWIDDVHVGRQDSLSVPHRYEFVAPENARRLTVTIRIDNTPRIPVGRIGHALTDWTQTNWNGVIGAMTLGPATDPLIGVRVAGSRDHLRVYGATPHAGRLRVSTAAGSAAAAEFDLESDQPFELDVPLPSVSNWSPDAPRLVDVTLEFGSARSVRRTGLRSIEAVGKFIELNGRRVFLRGTLECCVFPRTGYPPTDPAAWRQVMAKAKEFGLNHLRFHSWCPPEAAFAAADELGMLLQVELPVWTGLWAISSEPSLLDFCRREARRILAEYGHHPSFILFGLGNEIAFYGPEPEVDALLAELRAEFPNRLYTFSAHGTHLSDACDYYVQADNGKPGANNRPLRGSTWFGVGSRFDRERPSTLVNCDEAAAQFDRPVISHEVGEWAVFPEVHRAKDYDGVLEARNFRAIASMLRVHGMEDRAKAFVHASGKLSALLYKEEIETLLRTRGLAGYQLLGLTDFPGQGTATVGMLDAFWEEKGFIDAAEFRRFCGPTVPLLAYRKAIWLDGEQFEAEAMLFHAGAPQQSDLTWRVIDRGGAVVLKGDWPARRLSACEATAFGTLRFAVSQLETPARYEVELVAGDAVNRWSIWCYPDTAPTPTLPDVFVASFYRQDVRDALRAGRKVWLRINPSRVWSGIPGRFAPAFWSPIHFKEQVGTMGTVIASGHPLFAQFPTDDHTDWQWWDVLTRSKAMNLNELPGEFVPEVQVIDRYERNDKLGALFEASVGEGSLLVTLIDFDDVADRPAARQLEHSIRTYLGAAEFAPTQSLSLADLDRLFAREP